MNVMLYLRKTELINSLAINGSQDHGLRTAHQCDLINSSKAPSFGDILNTFSKAGDMCRKEVTFINTPSSMVWIQLVSVLKGHSIHIPTLSLCVRGSKDKGITGWMTAPSLGDGEGI